MRARFAFAFGFLVLPGCSKKATQKQCDDLVTRYAELVVKEEHPDASTDDIRKAKDTVLEEARSDDNFRNCTSEVESADYDCAMKAPTSHALEKCVE